MFIFLTNVQPLYIFFLLWKSSLLCGDGWYFFLYPWSPFLMGLDDDYLLLFLNAFWAPILFSLSAVLGTITALPKRLLFTLAERRESERGIKVVIRIQAAFSAKYIAWPKKNAHTTKSINLMYTMLEWNIYKIIH